MAASQFEVYQDSKKQWRWRLRHSNKKVLADSGESYTRRPDAIRAVAGMKAAVNTAELLLPPDEKPALKAPAGIAKKLATSKTSLKLPAKKLASKKAASR